MSTENTLPEVQREHQVEESTTHDGNKTIRSRKTTITTTTTTTSTSSSHGGDVTKKLAYVGLYQTLGKLQAASGVSLAAFVAIHIIPPALAVVGGTELSNRALLWGRVYYQNPLVELTLVVGAFTVHTLSGTLRAFIRTYWKAKPHSRAISVPADEATSDSGNKDRSPSSSAISASDAPNSTSFFESLFSSKAAGVGLFQWQRWTGWSLVPIVLGHAVTYRLVPWLEFGDSSMVDYSLVTFMFRDNALLQYFYFLPLIGVGVYHFAGGLVVSIDRSLPKKYRFSTKTLRETKKAKMVLAAVAIPLLTVGLYRFATAPGYIPMAKYYQRML
ncbi:hypothetical protein DFQ27_002978 [Actinomortierella ambigua]|uniref:Mitochondrial adapter protein MCP1 transmembrane domain-containing protein n=1 Tax=Actinomortierella ambigua TaxID=1343610 RepID=A0A9P6U6I5_9FUNG|nr:hypothetical protein DFQ27_002978 [Actinomortierella ambigua]